MIVNDDSRVINKLETLLTDDARVVIYDRHMFIEQATSGQSKTKLAASVLDSFFSGPLLSLKTA
jgi:hypothetical protein